MIFNSFEIDKININKNKFILLYGKNEGYKKEVTNVLLKDKKEIKIYEEKEIHDNSETFIEEIISQSLFEDEKIIIIKRVSDKLIKIIEEISSKNIKDIIIIFNAGNLEKKSKIRSFFEKDKKFATVAFYPDNHQTLSKIAYNFLRKENLQISTSNINLIVNKCNGDRENLLNELKKIMLFSKNGKKLMKKIF